jgi:ABC-type phosphate transport system ATPase subunit
MELERVITVKNLCLYYGENQALKNINLDMYQNKVVLSSGLRAAASQRFCEP